MSLPIMLNVNKKKVLVVGGGKIGTRKAISLYEAGAIVTSLSLDFTQELKKMSDKIVLKNKPFEACDVLECFLVIAATDDIETNRRVYMQCKETGILCQTVDRYNESDFDFMATHYWKDLALSVSTYGKAPKFSKYLIQVLADTIDDKQLRQLKKEIADREQLFNKQKQQKEENNGCEAK